VQTPVLDQGTEVLVTVRMIWFLDCHQFLQHALDHLGGNDLTGKFVFHAPAKEKPQLGEEQYSLHVIIDP